jgi:hypothetical protein
MIELKSNLRVGTGILACFPAARVMMATRATLEGAA